MVVGVVAQTDDVIIHVSRLHTVEEICHDCRFGGALIMQDDLCLRTFLTTSLACLFQQIDETVPVSLGRGGVAAVVLVVLGLCFCSPQHSVRDFIPRLNHVGSGSCSLHLLQTVLGVFVDFLVEFLVRERLPRSWCPLLGGISPGVAVVEVEHQLHTRLLDALTKLLHEVQILAHRLVVVVRRINEQSYPHGVQSFLAEEGEHIAYCLTVCIPIHHSRFLIFRQQGNISSHILLRLQSNAAGEQTT